MITAHDFFESTAAVLRLPLKDPVLQEAFLKAPEAVKQVMVNIQAACTSHVLRFAACDEFGHPRLMSRNLRTMDYAAIADMSVALTSVESISLDYTNSSICFKDSEKVVYKSFLLELFCSSGAAYGVSFYKGVEFYANQEKDNVPSLLMQASTLTFFLYSLWTVRLGNTYPLLPKGSVYGN